MLNELAGRMVAAAAKLESLALDPAYADECFRLSVPMTHRRMATYGYADVQEVASTVALEAMAVGTARKLPAADAVRLVMGNCVTAFQREQEANRPDAVASIEAQESAVDQPAVQWENTVFDAPGSFAAVRSTDWVAQAFTALRNGTVRYGEMTECRNPNPDRARTARGFALWLRTAEKATRNDKAHLSDALKAELKRPLMRSAFTETLNLWAWQTHTAKGSRPIAPPTTREPLTRYRSRYAIGIGPVCGPTRVFMAARSGEMHGRVFCAHGSCDNIRQAYVTISEIVPKPRASFGFPVRSSGPASVVVATRMVPDPFGHRAVMHTGKGRKHVRPETVGTATGLPTDQAAYRASAKDREADDSAMTLAPLGAVRKPSGTKRPRSGYMGGSAVTGRLGRAFRPGWAERSA